MTTNRRRPYWVAGASALLLILAAAQMSGTAKAYWWTWPTYPYQSDNYSNWAYRDMEFSWNTWVSNGSFFSGIYVYVHISSPSAGYVYESYGGAVMSSGGGNAWAGAGTYVDYSSGLTWMSAPFIGGGASGRNSDVAVATSICETVLCGAFSTAWGQGSVMWAIVPMNGTTGYCATSILPGSPSRWNPTTYFC